MPAQPQDRRPAKGKAFTFTGKDGKKHTLPNADQAIEKLSGKVLRDAIVGGEIGQMAYMFHAVEASGATPEALDALYALPQEQTTDVLQQWSDHGDGLGASLGESPGSSS
jgi:hypothetical protein